MLDSGDPNGSRSCQYLFAAYHSIIAQGGSKKQVSFEDWVSYWFKGKSLCLRPLAQNSDNIARPETVQNLQDWPYEVQKIFSNLCVKDRLKEETYLAAFLSCWLCSFVFPEEGQTIRPSTFKIASIMAKGVEICLGIPVLARIYKALHEIGNSPTPGKSYAYFPAHYVYGWLACYFRALTPKSQQISSPKMLEYAGEGREKIYTKERARNLIHLGIYFK